MTTRRIITSCIAFLLFIDAALSGISLGTPIWGAVFLLLVGGGDK